MIETERLVIRPPTVAERRRLLELWLDPTNERVHGDPSLEQIRAWVDAVPTVVLERDSGELVGDCSLSFDQGFEKWELSYGFRRDRWGRGYATEAALACVRHGFETMRVEKIVADVDPANTASSRVLDKCGFVRVGELDGKLFYAIVRAAG